MSWVWSWVDLDPDSNYQAGPRMGQCSDILGQAWELVNWKVQGIFCWCSFVFHAEVISSFLHMYFIKLKYCDALDSIIFIAFYLFFTVVILQVLLHKVLAWLWYFSSSSQARGRQINQSVYTAGFLYLTQAQIDGRLERHQLGNFCILRNLLFAS